MILCKNDNVSMIHRTIHRDSWGAVPKRQRRQAEATYYSGFMVDRVGCESLEWDSLFYREVGR
jgi:hypothetical protein